MVVVSVAIFPVFLDNLGTTVNIPNGQEVNANVCIQCENKYAYKIV